MGASFVLALLSTADGFRDSGDDFPNGGFLDTVLGVMLFGGFLLALLFVLLSIAVVLKSVFHLFSHWLKSRS